MSDEKTTTEEKTFGIRGTASRDRYRTAVRRAEAAYSNRINEISQPINNAVNAMFTALGRTNPAYAIETLMRSQANTRLNEQIREAGTVRDQAVAEARRVRDADPDKTDAFFEFVNGYIRDEHGEGYADDLVEAMPLTFDRLKALAWREDWCTDFERVMGTAVQRGALPADTVEVRYDVDWYDVPSRYNARSGQTWQRVATFPAYVRTHSRHGTLREFYDVERWVTDSRFEQVDADAS